MRGIPISDMSIGVLSVLLCLAIGVFCCLCLSNKPNYLESLTFGPIISLTLISFGLVLEIHTGIYGLRYFPLGMCFAFYLLKHPKNLKKKRPLLPAGMSVKHLWLFVISIVISIPLIANSWRASISSNGSTNLNNHYWLYPDLQYYWSLSTESISRVPQVFPHSAQDPLKHTWLFHSTLGSISDLSNISVNQLTFWVWPMFFCMFSASALFLICFKLTRSIFYSFIGILFFELFRGPSIPKPLEWITSAPLNSLSPQRDYATLLLLTLIYLLSDEITDNKYALDKCGFIILISLVAASSKGSIFLLIAGASIIAFIYETMKVKSLTIKHLKPWALIVLGVLLAQIFVVRITGDLKFSLFNSSIGQEVGKYATVTTIYIYFYVLLIVVLSFFTFSRGLTNGFGSFLFGLIISSFIGLVVFDHPGLSQVYFWQSAIPAVSIIVSLFLCFFQDLISQRLLLFVLVTSLSLRYIFAHGQDDILTTLFLIFILIAVKRPWFLQFLLKSIIHIRRGIQVFFLLFVLVGISSFSFFSHQKIGGWNSKEDFFSVSQPQIEAFRFLKNNTKVDDLVISNSHCLSSDISDRRCKPIALYLAGISERRIIAGADYAWGEDEIRFARAANFADHFLINPSADSKSKLLQLGIDYIVIDKTETTFSRIERAALSDFSIEVYSNTYVSIIKL